MSRLEWLTLWDKLRDELQKKNSWGKNEILAVMDDMERKAVREAEHQE